MNKLTKGTLFNRSGILFANLMVLVALIHFCIWYVFLNYQSIFLAFTKNIYETNFTLINFQKIMTELKSPDTIMYEAIINTLKYFVLGIVKLLICYFISYFFFKKVYFHKIYKFIFFLPSMISATVTITVFKSFVNTNGPIYMLLYNFFGYEMPHLLSSGHTATPLIMFFVLWSGFGIQFMIFVGTMNRIPTEVFEAAKLDGCHWLREIAQIVIPLTWDTLMVYLLLGFTGIFMSTGPILYFTGMNEFLGTYTIPFYIFAQTRMGQLNYASAIGLFFTVFTVPIVVIVRLIMRRFNKEITY